MVSTCSVLTGAGKVTLVAASGNADNSCFRRAQPCRAATKPFQCAIASSIGASALPIMIELAIMMPPVASCLMTR